MRLEVLHVAQGVDADAAADDPDDERHEQRKGVEVEPFGHRDAVREGELEHQRAHHLHGGQHARPHVPVTDAVVQDGRGHQHAHGRADVVRHGRVELERHPRRAHVGDHQPDGRHADDGRRDADNRLSRLVVANGQQDGRNNQREKDQKPEHSHVVSPFAKSLLIIRWKSKPYNKSDLRRLLTATLAKMGRHA